MPTPAASDTAAGCIERPGEEVEVGECDDTDDSTTGGNDVLPTVLVVGGVALAAGPLRLAWWVNR